MGSAEKDVKTYATLRRPSRATLVTGEPSTTFLNASKSSPSSSLPGVFGGFEADEAALDAADFSGIAMPLGESTL
jgi:hypothetical protein